MSDWENRSDQPWGAGESNAAPDRPQNAAEAQYRTLEKLVRDMQAEQRRSRRWGIFFRLLSFIFLFIVLFAVLWPSGDGLETRIGPHTAVIDVKGEIGADRDASAKHIIDSLQKAVSDPDTKGIILRVNSPGGSPVQAGMVYDEIRRLQKQHPHTKIYAVISDIGASGAYYIASAANDIYADKASLVGSIGVISSGFGFTGLMQKLGIDRRLYTAGDHKAFLDPFSPAKPKESQFWNHVLQVTHEQFIKAVEQGRGARLKKDDKQLFSGLVWTGQQALGLGLIDGYGTVDSVARSVIGAKTLVDYSYKPSPFQRLARRFGESFGSAMGNAVVHEMFDQRPSLQ